MSSKNIRILIADDHPLVREGLRSSIEQSDQPMAIVCEASDGLQVLQAARKHNIDVFLLDITMPRLNGLDVARTLLGRDKRIKIILLSFNSSRELVVEAMEVGIRGYLTKETAGRNVVEAICEVYSGGFYLSPDIARFMVEKAVAGIGDSSASKKLRLTIQERKVLQLIAEGKTAKEIASMLGLSVNTIHAHRKSLMAKTGIHKGTDLVRFAIREGIAKL